jgi:hypothetical protein
LLSVELSFLAFSVAISLDDLQSRGMIWELRMTLLLLREQRNGFYLIYYYMLCIC